MSAMPPTEGPSSADGASRAGVVRNASYLALGQIGTTALAVVLSASLGRALGTSDFGIYFLATSMATFAYVFVEWGQGPIVTGETARTPEAAGDLLGTALLLRLLSTVVVAIPLLLIALLLGYDRHTRWLLFLYFVTTLPIFLAQGFGMVFRGRNRMGSDALVYVLHKAAGLALVIVVLTRGGGLAAVAIAQCAAGLGALVLARYLYSGLRAPRLTCSRATAAKLWVGGAPIIAMTAANAVQPYLDVVILSKLVPADAMGWYAVAKNILGTLLAPALILGTAAYPQLSQAAGDPGRFRDEVRSAFRPMLLMGALGGAGTYLFADAAVHFIYGKAGYAPAATILQVFAPGMFLLFIDVLLGTVLLAAGRSKGFAATKVASVVVCALLEFILIPWAQSRYGNGGIGAVAALALSEIVVFACAIGLMPRGALTPKHALDAAKAAGAAVLTVLLLKAVPGLPLALGIPLCIAIFAIAAAVFRLLRREDLELLALLVRRRTSAVRQPFSEG